MVPGQAALACVCDKRLPPRSRTVRLECVCVATHCLTPLHTVLLPLCGWAGGKATCKSEHSMSWNLCPMVSILHPKKDHSYLCFLLSACLCMMALDSASAHSKHQVCEQGIKDDAWAGHARGAAPIMHRHSVRSHLDVSSFSSNMESLEPVQKGGSVFANQGPGGERAL